MRVATGNGVLDAFLDGGLDSGCITTVYGPAGAGKTNIALLSTVGVVRSGKKVIYIDTEGGMSVERLTQIAPDHEHILKDVIFYKPTTFKEQEEAFSKLRSGTNVGLIVVDSVAMLYRLELNPKDAPEVNRAMGKQLALLTEIARKKDIPILITNQVYALFDSRDKIQMVGGDLLRYASKCLIELQITPNARRAVLKKHRSMPAEKIMNYAIVNSGIVEVKEKRFSLF